MPEAPESEDPTFEIADRRLRKSIFWKWMLLNGLLVLGAPHAERGGFLWLLLTLGVVLSLLLALLHFKGRQRATFVRAQDRIQVTWRVCGLIWRREEFSFRGVRTIWPASILGGRLYSVSLVRRGVAALDVAFYRSEPEARRSAEELAELLQCPILGGPGT